MLDYIYGFQSFYNKFCMEIIMVILIVILIVIRKNKNILIISIAYSFAIYVSFRL